MFFAKNKKTDECPPVYYGIFEDELIDNIEKERDKAIAYIFSKPQFKEKFKRAFMDFSSRTDSFNKLDKRLDNDFLKHDIIPLLKEYEPDENSLGLRVMDIIESDLSKKNTLIFIPEEYDTVIEKLINVSNSYITELEKLQQESIMKNGIAI